MIRAAAYAFIPPSSVRQHCKMSLIYDFLGFLAGMSPQVLIRFGCLWAWLPSTCSLECVWYRYNGPVCFHDDELRATTYEKFRKSRLSWVFSKILSFFGKSYFFFFHFLLSSKSQLEGSRLILWYRKPCFSVLSH